MLKIRHIFCLSLLFFLCQPRPVVGQSLVSPKNEELKLILQKAKRSNSDALLIWQDGKLQLEYYTGGPDQKIETMSVTKSILSLAVGRLFTTGVLSDFDQPIWHFYPEWRQGRKQAITLRHLLSHTSGLQNEKSTSLEIYPSPDFVQLALSAELSSEPGLDFSYNNKATNLLAGVVEKASGKKLDRYLAEELFSKLGIIDFDWSKDKTGNPHGMSGLQIRPKDLLKLGLLVLNEGRFKGEHLLAKTWLEESLKPQGNLGCGFLWWLLPENIEFSVTDASLELLQERAPVHPSLEAAARMLGSYSSKEELQERLEVVLGAGFREQKETLTLWKKHLIKPKVENYVGYLADGYQGQYLLILPKERVLAVRMKRWTENHQASDSYSDFAKDVIKWAQSSQTGP